MRFREPSFKGHQRQKGAVLYVALIMLILLALIGTVGMQVSTLQERMSANYLAVNMAFQQAELRARQTELEIQSALTGGDGVYAANQEVCSPSFDPLSWATGVTANAQVYTRRIDRCFASSSRKIGAKENEETGNIYEVTALASNRATDASSNAVINTIFIP